MNEDDSNVISTSRTHIIPIGADTDTSRDQSHASATGRLSLELLHVVSSALGEREREFIDLVDSGDLGDIQRFLEDHSETNINIRDSRGRSALQIAVRNQHVELVETLLQNDDVHIGDSLLIAAREGNLKVVQLLLEWIDNHPDVEENKIQSSAEFTGDVTPLIVSAIYGHVDIVRIFLHRDGPIVIPHSPDCKSGKCQDDKLHGNSSELYDSITRINTYRALANPAYLSTASEDPILLAFDVAEQLQKEAKNNLQDADKYSQLYHQCEQFTVDLLAQCRTTSEVELLLRQKSVTERNHILRHDLEFARLYLAKDIDMKEFITHSNCQKVLRGIWLGRDLDWLKYRWYERWLYVCRAVLMFVPMVLFYLLSPPNKLQKPLTVPLNRFIFHTITFSLFLFCVFVLLSDRGRGEVHGKILEPPEYYIILWVCGLLFEHLMSLYKSGMQQFYENWARLYDMVMICLFSLTFLLWIISYLVAKSEDSFDLPRHEWKWYDTTLIAEGVFALASMFAFVRVLDLFRLSKSLGPLQLSLVNMVSDIIRFLCVFFVIVFAYATGLTALYRYYKGNIRYDSDGEVLRSQADDFVAFFPTYKTLFWTIFGYGDPDLGDIVVNYTMPVNATAEDIPKHYFTESVGYLLWGTYHIMAIIILLNMLIAMMSNTYQYFQDNADIEWKFSRSKLWMTYFETQSTMPPPLNLIPSMTNIYAVIIWLKTRLTPGSSSNDKAEFQIKGQGCYIETEAQRQNKEHDKAKYKDLIQDLVQRYFYSSGGNRSSSEKLVTLEELDNVKQELIREIQKVQEDSQKKPAASKSKSI